jgi:hypothetical protein
VPFIGVKDSLLHTLKFVVDKWGPVAGFYLGAQPAIVIADFNIVKGIFINSNLLIGNCGQ